MQDKHLEQRYHEGKPHSQSQYYANTHAQHTHSHTHIYSEIVINKTLPDTDSKFWIHIHG